MPRRCWEGRDSSRPTGTSGPIIANGKVISGRSCRPVSGPTGCVTVAHDAASGAELWWTRLVPAPGEPGDETWGGVPYEERVHVASWMVPSYDPELDLVYVGTSVTSPAPGFLLAGIPGKTGLVYTLDPKTGKFLWATPTVTQNLISDIDGATGEVTARRTTWLREQRAATLSLVTTGGGLVFGGDLNRRFRALDQETGEVLSQFKTRVARHRLPDQLRGPRPPVSRCQHRHGRKRVGVCWPDARASSQIRGTTCSCSRSLLPLRRATCGTFISIVVHRLLVANRPRRGQARPSASLTSTGARRPIRFSRWTWFYGTRTARGCRPLLSGRVKRGILRNHEMARPLAAGRPLKGRSPLSGSGRARGALNPDMPRGRPGHEHREDAVQELVAAIKDYLPHHGEAVATSTC